MPDSFEVTTTLPATPAELYEAWLDGKQHAEFTGARATVEPRIGGAFTAWDGYIRGHIVDLFPNSRIIQEWITTEFPAEAEPSRVEITFQANNDGTTTLVMRHSNIPDGQGTSYEQGWHDHYFEPLKQYFEARRAGTPKPSPGTAGEPGVGLRSEEKEANKTAARRPAKQKKTAARGPAKKKKAAARRPAKKKAAASSTSRKKTAAGKKAAKKQTSARKPAKKKANAGKKPAKKKTSAAARKPSKKKATTGKKKTSARKRAGR